jgi:DNA-directed RNA polymerase alpha subunit
MSDFQAKVCVKPGFEHIKSENGKNVVYKAGDTLFVRRDELEVLGWKLQDLSPSPSSVVLDISEVEDPEIMEEEVVLGISETEDPEIVEDEIEQYELGDLEDIPLDRLNISSSIRSRLASAGIKTARDLLEKDPDDILKIRGIGPKILEDILADAKSAIGT